MPQIYPECKLHLPQTLWIAASEEDHSHSWAPWEENEAIELDLQTDSLTWVAMLKASDMLWKQQPLLDSQILLPKTFPFSQHWTYGPLVLPWVLKNRSMGKAGKEKGPVGTIAVFSVCSGYFYSFVLKRIWPKAICRREGVKRVNFWIQLK